MIGEAGLIVIGRHLVGLNAGDGVLTEEGWVLARQGSQGGQGVTNDRSAAAAAVQLRRRSGWST